MGSFFNDPTVNTTGESAGPNPEGALAPTPEMSKQIVQDTEQTMAARIAAEGVPSATNQGAAPSAASTTAAALLQSFQMHFAMLQSDMASITQFLATNGHLG